MSANEINVEFYDGQKKAIDELRSGSVLCGGVGTGKSRTAIGYFVQKECKYYKGSLTEPMDLYIITTARKRDTHEWEAECAPFFIFPDPDESINGIKLTIDSWNNIKKYKDVENSFFIFDEQRVISYGSWTKNFLDITKKNRWILLSATPGDTWMDYMPVFIANGFYKNKSEFIRQHVIYSRFSKYPKIDRYVEVGTLIKHRNDILVTIEMERHTVPHMVNLFAGFDKQKYSTAMKTRWNMFENKPMRDAGELCRVLRTIVNSDYTRMEMIQEIMKDHPKVIIFYNFDYELAILRKINAFESIEVAEWNGHKHEPIPDSKSWVYLVQYTAGCEGWNCIQTDTIIFYSLNYSYKVMTQAAGRIDRRNTPFVDLYYYYLTSHSSIDMMITKALNSKKNFNETAFYNQCNSQHLHRL